MKKLIKAAVLSILSAAIALSGAVSAMASPFLRNDGSVGIYEINGELTELYAYSVFVDLNGDSRSNAADARILLRISASLEEYDGDIDSADIVRDGKLTAADARSLLRSAARLDSYLMTADSQVISGFARQTGKTVYVTANGSLASGLVSIGGATYLFTQSGEMLTGLREHSGVKYYFGSDGKAVTGCVKSDGRLYVFGSDYKAANGFATVSGSTYYCTDGVAHTGWLNLDGARYYFGSDGKMAVNTTVDGIRLGADGKAATVDKSFFDDAVFIGDSISVSMMYYQRQNGVLGKAQVYAASSLSAANALWSVSSSSVHPYYGGSKMLVEDIVRASGAKKLFIMLGMNDIGIYSHDTCIKNYKELIRRVKAKSPNIDVYIQSMTPMTSISTRADSKLNNTQIRRYNERLKAMAAEMGWHYVDIYSGLADANGCLPTAYCSDPVYMGIHLSNSGCRQWANHLLKSVYA